MNSNSQPPHDRVADQNVERLLASSYHPEEVDPAFAEQVRRRALQKSQHRRSQSNDLASLPPSRAHLHASILSAVLLTALLIAATLIFSRAPAPDRKIYRDGEFVWIDGKPYSLAEDNSLAETKETAPVAVNARPRAPALPLDGAGGLTARARKPSPAVDRAMVGQTIVTKANERRRVALPDGSMLYLNENTAAKVDQARRLVLSSGQVFVEVAPRNGDAPDDVFRVATPDQEVSALGTKFIVSVDGGETDVVVTQGKVKASGSNQTLSAGQKLRADGEVVPAVRAAHALHWARELIAPSQSALVPASEHQGGALMAVDGNGHSSKLALRKLHVDVHIEDGFARTTIDQTYFNHHAGRLEGTFYFPLPPDASISRLAMYVGGKLMEGGMAERDHARNVFETIKYRSLDPALLEWVDGSTFKMRVFPLEGRQEKRIILSYTQKLNHHYGRSQYRFPAGHSLNTAGKWSVKIHVADELRWKCPSHSLTASASGSGVTLAASTTEETVDRDIVLDLFDDDESENPVSERSRLSTFDHDGWRYLMLRHRPRLAASPQRRRRDWVFLFEADGGRDPLLARVQIDVVRTLLENAERDDTFSLITAGASARAFSTQREPVTPEKIAAAVSFLDNTHLIGALDLEQAFQSAGALVEGAENPVLVHLGAATPILGERAHDQLLQAIPESTYVGVGVGRTWNRLLMKEAASRSGGYFTQINPDEPTRWQTLDLLSNLDAPRLLDIRVEADGELANVHVLQDFASHGEEICAVARFADKLPQSLTLTGQLGGEIYRREIATDDVYDGAGALPRIWAKLAIDDMVARGAQENREEIIELSKSMYVMSPFTSLLVLENDEMYEQYHIDRGRKDHWAMYPCPDKIEVVHEPMETPPASADDQPNRPSVEEVLKSLLAAGRKARGSETSFTDHRYLLFGDVRNVPLLNKFPYVNRLFRNDTNNSDPLMMMVTPRIHIIEEEEPLLGLDLDGSSAPLTPALRTIDSDGGNVADFDALIELIEDMISPTTWQDVGGNGVVAPFPTNLSLIVSQTQQVHGDVGQMLTTLHPVGDLVVPVADGEINLNAVTNFGLFDPFANGSPFLPSGSHLPTVEEAKIRKALDRQDDFDYQNMPLSDVLQGLSQRFDVPIVIHQAAKFLAEAKGNSVNLTVQGVSLQSAMRLLTDSLGLTYYVSDDGLHVTTPRDREDRLASLSQNLSESLLLFPPAAAQSPPAEIDRSTIDDLASHLARQSSTAKPAANLLYQPPRILPGRKMFRSLLDFAPAFRTTVADVLAAVDEEAWIDNRPRKGAIDPDAARLIARARKQAWQAVSLEREPGKPIRLVVNGQGQFRCQRKTADGLTETIVCDGESLRHLYPELGLAAARNVSRFHRAQFSQLLPWLVPPVDDLAFGADVRLIGPRTVAIAPHCSKNQKKEKAIRRLHLVFGNDGLVKERRLVEMPSGKTVARRVWAEGAVRLFNEQGTPQVEQRFTIEPATRPGLSSGGSSLVTLPMPIRSREHVIAAVSATERKPSGDRGALEKIAQEEQSSKASDPAHWPEQDALRLVASLCRLDASELRDVIGRRFFSRGDRRIGFYTLLFSCGSRLDVDAPASLSDGATTRMNPIEDHPDSALANYIYRQSVIEDDKQHAPLDGNEFVGQLSMFSRLDRQWRHEAELPQDAQLRRAALDEAFEFIERAHSPTFAYLLLRRIQGKLGDAQPHGRVAEALLDLERKGLASYVVKYELASSLAKQNSSLAASLFRQLHGEALAAGFAPPIDSRFLNTIGPDAFDDLMRQACMKLIEQKRRPLAMALAHQCRKLGREQVAGELVDLTLTGAGDDELPLTTVSAVDYFLRERKFDRAHAALKVLLGQPSHSDSAPWLRLASSVAAQGGQLARSIDYLERSLEVERQAMPVAYNVERWRNRYTELFSKYEVLARMAASPADPAPLDLARRVVTHADRWRVLETDVTHPCQQAARVLSAIGHEELAWEYLTTPLAQKPNEAAPWSSMAEELARRHEVELASRSYTAAFQAEPTNAQILWDHAQMLDRAGRRDAALELYRKIASGDWQVRFASLKRRASRMIETRPSC